MIDFHCHVDLFPRPEEVIREADSRNIYVLAVTTTPKAWSGLKLLLGDSARVRPALGLHPELARERESELCLFDDLVSETRYVGEIGLDGSPAHRGSLPAQKRVFDAVLQSCASAGGRILSIHSRCAATEVLDALERRPEAGKPVFHWFSGTAKELERAISLGAWFSVGPAMLSSMKGRDLALRMPKDRILTESDGPFARISSRAAMPWDVGVAESILTSIWQVSKEATTKLLKGNFKTLLS